MFSRILWKLLEQVTSSVRACDDRTDLNLSYAGNHMDNAELMQILIKALRDCANRRKYCGKTTSADEDNALQVFSLLMENPSLPEDLVIRVLTGEKKDEA